MWFMVLKQYSAYANEEVVYVVKCLNVECTRLALKGNWKEKKVVGITGSQCAVSMYSLSCL